MNHSNNLKLFPGSQETGSTSKRKRDDDVPLESLDQDIRPSKKFAIVLNTKDLDTQTAQCDEDIIGSLFKPNQLPRLVNTNQSGHGHGGNMVRYNQSEIIKSTGHDASQHFLLFLCSTEISSSFLNNLMEMATLRCVVKRENNDFISAKNYM